MPILGTIASSKLTGPISLNAFESIATTSISSGTQNTITFSSIPSTFKHLQLRLIGRTNRAGNIQANLVIRFNNDTGTNYALHELYADKASNGTVTVDGFASSSQTAIIADRLAGNDALANNFGAIIIDILDYADTNKYKAAKILGGMDNGSGSTGGLGAKNGIWMSTAAINEIDLTSVAGTVDFTQYSHFALYGIKETA